MPELTLNSPCYVIAEASINHDSFGRLKQSGWQECEPIDVADVSVYEYEEADQETINQIQDASGKIYRYIPEDRLVAFKFAVL